jgi:hypothetical protein
LAYAVIVVAALLIALSARERVMAPEPPPPMPGAALMPLAADSPFAASPITPASADIVRQARTAFSLGEAGVWLSADTEACARPALVIADGRAAPARTGARLGLLRIFTTAGAGTPGLPQTAARDLRPGELGFQLGFPRGGPGEAALRLIGPRILRPLARAQPRQRVLAWAEVGHTEGLQSARPGLIGAPVLDREGRVAGVTLAQSPRRGRIYTTTPEDLSQALAAARITPGASSPGQPIAADNYGRAADELRRDLRVVQLICLRG